MCWSSAQRLIVRTCVSTSVLLLHSFVEMYEYMRKESICSPVLNTNHCNYYFIQGRFFPPQEPTRFPRKTTPVYFVDWIQHPNYDFAKPQAQPYVWRMRTQKSQSQLAASFINWSSVRIHMMGKGGKIYQPYQYLLYHLDIQSEIKQYIILNLIDISH